MDLSLLNVLLNSSESETLDFKRDQYPFQGASNEQKSELVKDLLAFANAWKISDAHILVGVEESPGQQATVIGITQQIDDASIQQLVNSKTNKPIRFNYVPANVGGKQIGVFRIHKIQDRPIFLRRNYGNLQQDVVYIRRSSSTDIARPDEIAEMGRDAHKASLLSPTIEVQFADAKSKRGLGNSFSERTYYLDDKHLPKYTRVQGNPFLGNSPHPQEIRDYRIRVFGTRPVRFLAKNTSSVTAVDCRLTFSVPKRDGVIWASESEMPSEPRGQFEMHIPNVHVGGDIDVDETDDQYFVSVDFGKLQPHAERISGECLYITAFNGLVEHIQAKVFADNLAPPLDVPLNVNIQTEAHLYDSIDWNKEDE